MVNLNYHYPLEYNMKDELHLPIHFAHKNDPKSWIRAYVGVGIEKLYDHGMIDPKNSTEHMLPTLFQ